LHTANLDDYLLMQYDQSTYLIHWSC